MAFHPASGRVVREDGVAGEQRPDGNNANDEISDFSSDLDDPYHETAADWHHRSARRRARRLAGISSSSSSSEGSIGESEADSEGHDDNAEGGEEEKRRREMEKAARSAKRPLERWLASHPLVAARCCLSAVPSALTMDDVHHQQHRGQYNNCDAPPLSAREQEGKRLRRIFRRMRRKQKEYQAKFADTVTTTAADAPLQQPNSAYYQSSNALSVDQMAAINQDCAETEKDRLTLHSLLPHGTGISFIDAVLGRESLPQSKSAVGDIWEQKTFSRLVLEMSGPARSGITSILLAVAARYVASTSNIFLGDGCPTARCDGASAIPSGDDATTASGDNPRPMKRRRNDNSTASHATEPRVVILDLEKGVHAAKLILSVREAVLRRWDETAPARQWRKEQQKLWAQNGSEAVNSEMLDEVADESDNSMYEHRQIELAIASCLGRMHVVQPKDFTYLSLVATMEMLRHNLDKERALKSNVGDTQKQFGGPVKTEKGSSFNVIPQEPPTLILIDSLTTLDASTRFQEGLTATSLGSNRGSGSSGLSDRNVFYRQLMRLRDEHEVAIIGVSRSAANASKHKDSSWGASGPRGSSGLWDKMVSHRVNLHHVAEGTAEDQAGYDFVATTNASGNNDGPGVFPYAVTAGGIAC